MTPLCDVSQWILEAVRAAVLAIALGNTELAGPERLCQDLPTNLYNALRKANMTIQSSSGQGAPREVNAQITEVEVGGEGYGGPGPGWERAHHHRRQMEARAAGVEGSRKRRGRQLVLLEEAPARLVVETSSSKWTSLRSSLRLSLDGQALGGGPTAGSVGGMAQSRATVQIWREKAVEGARRVSRLLQEAYGPYSPNGPHGVEGQRDGGGVAGGGGGGSGGGGGTKQKLSFMIEGAPQQAVVERAMQASSRCYVLSGCDAGE